MRNNIFFYTLLCLFAISCRKTESSPQVMSFTPGDGGVGLVITIKGNNFGSSASHVTIYFNTIAASPLTVTDSLITVQVPAGATSGKISVVVNGIKTESTAIFGILPGTWTKKADLPFAPGRAGGAGFAIGNKGYYIGGTNNGNYFNDVYEYDPATDQWTQETSCPGTHFASPVNFVIGNKIYIGICQNENGNSNEFWEYDPTYDAWTQMANFPGPSRKGVLSFAIGNQGFVGSNDPNVNDFWMYDQITDMWTQKNNPPPGVNSSWPASFVIGNNAYTGAGSVNSLFWKYDPLTDTWASETDFPGNPYGLSGCSINGMGYLFGYEDDSYAFDPTSDSWSPVAFFGIRDFGVSFVIGSNAYYGTGSGTEGFLNDFWEFTP
jgi:N-acetylneuraminic acid mutarotase